jgi:putative membrane protein
MKYSALVAIAVTGSWLMIVPGALAQTANPPQNTQSPAQGAQQSPTSADAFVQAAAVSDMFEIQSSRLALQKTSNAHIKAFARRMIKDHTASTQKLKSTLKSAKVEATPPSDLDAQHQQMLQQLQGLSGSEFDRTYAQMQLQGHQDTVKLLTDYSQSGDNAALKKFAASILPTVKDHLAHAEKLSDEVGQS